MPKQENGEESLGFQHPPEPFEWYQINHILSSAESDEGAESRIVLVAGVRTDRPQHDPSRCFAALLGDREYTSMAKAVRHGKIPSLTTLPDYYVMTQQIDEGETERKTWFRPRNKEFLAATVLDHPTFSTGESFSHALAESAYKHIMLLTKERAHSKNPVKRVVNVFRKLRLLRERKQGFEAGE